MLKYIAGFLLVASLANAQPMPIMSICMPAEYAEQYAKTNELKLNGTGMDAEGAQWALFVNSEGRWLLLFNNEDKMCGVAEGQRWKSMKP